MPLHDRYIDQEVDPVDNIGDLQLHTGTVYFVPFFLLCVDKRHAVLIRQRVIAAIVKGQGRAVSHPGSLGHDNIGKIPLLEILDDPGDDLGMCCCAKLSR